MRRGVVRPLETAIDLITVLVSTQLTLMKECWWVLCDVMNLCKIQYMKSLNSSSCSNNVLFPHYNAPLDPKEKKNPSPVTYPISAMSGFNYLRLKYLSESRLPAVSYRRGPSPFIRDTVPGGLKIKRSSLCAFVVLPRSRKLTRGGLCFYYGSRDTGSSEII